MEIMGDSGILMWSESSHVIAKGLKLLLYRAG